MASVRVGIGGCFPSNISSISGRSLYTFAHVLNSMAEPEPIIPAINEYTEFLEIEFDKLATNELILTDERAEHIKERHAQDYNLFHKCVYDVVIFLMLF